MLDGILVFILILDMTGAGGKGIRIWLHGRYVVLQQRIRDWFQKLAALFKFHSQERLVFRRATAGIEVRMKPMVKSPAIVIVTSLTLA